MNKSPCRCGRFDWPHRKTWDCVDFIESQRLEGGLDDEINQQLKSEWANERGQVAREYGRAR